MQGLERNVRGPSAQPESGQASSYKPKAKSNRAQRESEGIVVPDGAPASTKAVRQNAAGGKGPCGGHAEIAGKREGMAGKTGPKDPGAGDCGDKVRQLQRQLWAAAKRAPGRRFHALYGQMCRDDVLHEAWKRVRRNKGAAGVDRVTISPIEQHGVRRFLQELAEVLRAGEYGAQVVRRAYIPKADGAKRPLGIPTVQDRVWARHGQHLGEMVRYADDFVVMCRTARGLEESQSRIEHVMSRLGLKLHPQKTRRVALKDGLEGFDFLGCHLRKRMSGRLWQQEGLRRYYLQRWPSRKAMNRVRERVRELTPRGRCHQDMRGVIAELNPVLRGWGQYFQACNAANHFIDVDDYVVKRLRSLRVKRHGRNLGAGQADRWSRECFERLGLHRLRGTIRYPGKHNSWRRETA